MFDLVAFDDKAVEHANAFLWRLPIHVLTDCKIVNPFCGHLSLTLAAVLMPFHMVLPLWNFKKSLKTYFIYWVASLATGTKCGEGNCRKLTAILLLDVFRTVSTGIRKADRRSRNCSIILLWQTIKIAIDHNLMTNTRRSLFKLIEVLNLELCGVCWSADWLCRWLLWI